MHHFSAKHASGSHGSFHLRQDSDFRLLVYNRWKEKKEEVIDRVLQSLDLIPEQMPKSIEANYLVWPFNYQACGNAPMPEVSYSEELSKILRMINLRACLLDEILLVGTYSN